MLVYKHLMEILNTVSSWLQYTHITINTPDYWPMAREYSILNAVVAALSFWTADLEAHTLSSATEEVYRTFFYMPSAHTYHQISDEILFGHFVTMLNATFERNLALEDEGYKSGSENFNIPTPLRRTSKIHHVSSIENASFNPVPSYTMQYQTTLPQTCMQEVNIQPLWWWWYLRRWSFFTPQHATSTVPYTWHKFINFQVHICCLWTLGRWRRGFPNHPLGWWTLDYWRDSWQTIMHTWTFITTWTMPIPMSICRLPDSTLLWDHGFKWHLQIRRPDDHFQWWGYPCAWGCYTLKNILVWTKHLHIYAVF